MSNGSPAPGTPQTPTKAYVATALTFLAGVGLAFVGDDGSFTQKDLVEAVIGSGIASGIIGGVTFAVPNRIKRQS